MAKLYALLLLIAIFMVSCKTANKSFDRGDYREAINLGIKKLQKNPYDSQTLELVKESYAAAVSRYEASIRDLSGGKNESRYEAIYNEYLKMQRLYELINESPAAFKYVQPKNYSDYLATYREKSADLHIANAEKWEAENTKSAYREAYREYRKALNYRSDDVDLKKRRDAAYNAALVKVLVVPMQQNYGGYGYSNSYQLQNFQNDVMRTLSYNMGSEFVRFYSEWDLRNKDLEPDQIMELNLGRIVLGRPYDDRSSREVSKRVVVKETVYKPDSVVKEYATVRARLTTTRRTVLSEGDLYIIVRDVKGGVIWNDRFTGRHRWQTEFASYSGDERALSQSDKALLNRREDYPPTEEAVLEQLFREINNELSFRLRNYFARY